jgi:hypothetical protein
VERPRASVIVDDEFTEIGQKLPTVISAIADDLCSSESDTLWTGRRRSSGLLLNVRISDDEEEEHALLHTVEIRLPMNGRSGGESSIRPGGNSSS